MTDPKSWEESLPNVHEKKNQDASSEPLKDEPVYLTGARLLMVLTGVTLVCFLMLLDTSIISTAIPKITSQFHSLGDIGWYGSSYQIASACLQPLTGKIYTNFSSKWSFLAFFFVFELGSLLCGIASSSKMLIIARSIAGIGSSGLMNGSLTIIASSVPLHKSPALIGIIMGFSQLGVACGPLLGGAFTQYTTWRWCFYINLPIGALVAILILFIDIPDQAGKPAVKSPKVALDIVRRELDLFGFALFAPAAIQLLLALEYGQGEHAWNSATVIGLFCGAGGTFIVFLLWEYRQGDRAMIPLAMVAQRTVWSSCIFLMCVFAMVLCASYYLPIYFQAVRNDSPLMSGVHLLPSILSQLLLAVSSGALITNLGYYFPWAFFCAVFTSIGSGLISTFTPGTSTGKWVGYQIILGAGRGAGFQVPMIAVQNTLPATQISIAMSILMFIQTLSGAVFLTFGNLIFSSGLKELLPIDAPNVNPEVIIAAGASNIREVVSGQDLPGVLKAYAQSIDHVFYMCAALGVTCGIIAFGMGFKDIRQKKPTSPA
ncbi:hypothetical protein N7492_001067 [Penicillium capsulatum]|uniref:Major facilitator superfamily (MFS) profile domain-containing protein n=1 Tax=Penicillium capsulatum TaxID=69766 RepID=A0A9W9IX01_9EURO|nr:hypothetical protein N7492_001067 [Penicillium capsulatum]KAJ6129875.1 hypothetical protein N7512_002655 [Penicillium capsulatum]